MTEDAKDALMSALEALKKICGSIVDGSIIMRELALIKENKKAFQKLCAEANIENFDLQRWLVQLDSVVQYIGMVQEFYYLLDSSVQGEYCIINYTIAIYLCAYLHKLFIH